MTSRIESLLHAVAISALVLAGCGGSSSPSSADAGSGDSGVADAGSSGGDAGSADGGETCLQVITCAAGCAGGAACESACAAMGSPTAMQQYSALFGCAYAICTVPGDGGTTACSSDTDTSSGCQTCVDSAAQSTSCTAQLSACLGT